MLINSLLHWNNSCVINGGNGYYSATVVLKPVFSKVTRISVLRTLNII